MGNALLWNRHRLTTARIATHARRPSIDREATEAANFDAMPAHQCVGHGFENGLHGMLGVTVRELAETRGEFFNQI